MLPGMSRNSPSGPLEATDHKNLFFVLDAGNPSGGVGSYLVEAEGNFAGLTPNNAGDSNFFQGQYLGPLGVMTRKGRIGFARLAAGIFAPITGAVKMQWSVNGDLKGNVVDVPFTNVLPNDATNANMPSSVVDFGDVEWKEGDLVLLVVTIGTAFVGGGALNFVLAFDYDLEAGRPRS